MELTICIPTYNRKQGLLSVLDALLPQLDFSCHLYVLDNCSTENVESDVSQLFARHAQPNCYYLRRKVNIGACGNVLRAFELNDRGWLWICGDDDIPKPDAIRTLLAAINSYPEAAVVNFDNPFRMTVSDCSTSDAFVFKDVNFHSIGAVFTGLGFISANIYNIQKCSNHVEAGYMNTGSYLPHLAIALSALEAGEALFVFHNSKILTQINICKASYTNIAIPNFMRILQVIRGTRDRLRFRRFIEDSCKRGVRPSSFALVLFCHIFGNLAKVDLVQGSQPKKSSFSQHAAAFLRIAELKVGINWEVSNSLLRSYPVLSSAKIVFANCIGTILKPASFLLWSILPGNFKRKSVDKIIARSGLAY